MKECLNQNLSNSQNHFNQSRVANNHPFYLLNQSIVMKLTKNHRETLISDLKIANQDLIIQSKIWDNRNKKSEMSNESIEELNLGLQSLNLILMILCGLEPSH